MRPFPAPATLRAAAAAAALLAASPSFAQEADVSLGGTVTQRMYGAATEASAGAEYSYASTTTLEATLSAKGPALRAEFSAQAALLSGAAAQAFAVSALAVPSLVPADTLYSPTDLTDAETVLAARVRTAYVKWSAKAFSLTLGRQIVNYGKGAAWSPEDIFTKVDYSGLSLEREGSDAVRVTFPLGVLSLAEAVAGPRADPSEGTYALRLAGLLFNALDGSVLGAWEGQDRTWKVGGDAKIDLADISFHADAVFTLPSEGGEGTLRAVAGFDTSFGDFVLLGEYYYNAGGSASDANFQGRHNVYEALTWDISDFHALGVSSMWDLESGVFYAQATWNYDVAQNGNLTAYVKTGNGSFATGHKSWTAQIGAQFVVSF